MPPPSRPFPAEISGRAPGSLSYISRLLEECDGRRPRAFSLSSLSW